MIYPDQWHLRYGEKTFHSARVILGRLVDLLPMQSIAEIGCGNAHWTKAAIGLGIADYLVVDGPWNNRWDLQVDAAHFLEADLAEPLILDRRFDMALCLEVAEHIQTDRAAILVQSLARASDVVLFGAAIPLQGGFGHINEQWQGWWRDHFTREGFSAFDVIRPAHWSDPSVHYWYRQNCVLFVSDKASGKQDAVREYRKRNIDQWDMLDSVHPEKFMEIADYAQISLRRLLPRLPGHFARRIQGQFSTWLAR